MDNIVKTEDTHHYLGTCTECTRPIRVENSSGARYITAPCPQCERAVRCERLVAVTTAEVCDGRCMSAVGPACSCSCGGANHGSTWGIRTHTDLRLISALERYRAEAAKKAAKKQRENDRRKAEFDDWAADPEIRPLVEFLRTTDISHPFLDDMSDLVDRHKYLTDRQLAAVAKFAANARKNAEHRTEAEKRRAEGKAAPLGKALTVEGVIVNVKIEDSYFAHNAVTKRMLVDCDAGYRVLVTIPRSLTPVITSTVYQEMRGKRVRLVADLEPSKNEDDPSFVIGKRPRKAQFVTADVTSPAPGPGIDAGDRCAG